MYIQIIPPYLRVYIVVINTMANAEVMGEERVYMAYTPVLWSVI